MEKDTHWSKACPEIPVDAGIPDLTIRQRGSDMTDQRHGARPEPADRSRESGHSFLNNFNLNTPESAEVKRKDLTDFH